MSRAALPAAEPRSAVRQRRRRRAPALATPQLSIVIVNYHQWENTTALVRQILRTTAARRGAVEVVVVDNHSPPHPLAARLRRWPGVSLRRWGRNRGFARAVNEGCRLSRGSWLLLLNPDVTLTDGFLDGALLLADQLSANEPRAGVVGFQLRNSDGSRQLSSGYFPTLPGTLAGLMLPRARRKYCALRVRQRCRVPWVTGCCLLLRRDCLGDLGGLDESFFLYYEDVDLCRRARAHGWSVWYEPALTAIHHQPLHRRTVAPALRVMTRHSLLTYGARHWPAWQCRLLAGIVRVEAWGRRWLARWRGDSQAVKVFAQLGALARDFFWGDASAARRRLERVVRGNS
jgi:N-acetylglucosaminyl-diphospho-decaprenol L-rhamnosyltransferase